MKNWIIAGLVAVIAVGGAVAFAQSSRTANVEIRVWESTSDPTRNYISARPEGGSWSTLGTIPLGTGDASAYETTSNGRFRYSDITLAVPLPSEQAAAPAPTATPTPTTADVSACDAEVVRVLSEWVKLALRTPSTFQYLGWVYWPPINDVARIRFDSRAQNSFGAWRDNYTNAKLRVGSCEVFDISWPQNR